MHLLARLDATVNANDNREREGGSGDDKGGVKNCRVISICARNAQYDEYAVPI